MGYVLEQIDIGGNVDGLQLRNRCGRQRPFVGSPRGMRRNTACTECGYRDDNACGLHTLYYLLLHTTPEWTEVRTFSSNEN